MRFAAAEGAHARFPLGHLRGLSAGHARCTAFQLAGALSPLNSWVYLRVKPDRAVAGFWPEGSEPLWPPVGVAVGGSLGVPLGVAVGVAGRIGRCAVAAGRGGRGARRIRVPRVPVLGLAGRRRAGLPCAIARLMIAGAPWLCTVPPSAAEAELRERAGRLRPSLVATPLQAARAPTAARAPAPS